MNKTILLLSFLAIGTAQGQTDQNTAPSSNEKMTIGRAIETIGQVDEQYVTEEGEVLDSLSDEDLKDAVVVDVDEVDADPEVILSFDPEPPLVTEKDDSSAFEDKETPSRVTVAEVDESSDPELEALAQEESMGKFDSRTAGSVDLVVNEPLKENPSATTDGSQPMEEDRISSTASPATEIAGTIEKAPASPDLPDAPKFEIPDEEVFLELPGSEEGSSTMEREADTISIDFPQEDVRNIIRNVADLYELNVVIPDSLTGSVSIKLRDVTWRQVLQVILEPLNYTYIEDGNIIMIKSQDDLAIEPVDTRVFIINFAKAGEIKGSIEPLVNASTGGKIQVDTRSNALVITERPSRMNGIQEIIETLDRPTEQVMIESKFVEITARDQHDLGVDWQSLSGYSVQAGPFNRSYTNSNGREIENINDTIRNTSTTSLNGNQTNRTTDLATTIEDNTLWTGDLLRADTAVFSADAFSLVLSALESKTDVELISNPTIVTLNNTPAQINIGEEYPIPAYTYNSEQGTYEVSNFEYKNIGINLNVVPQINSAGFINLKIEPEISSRTGEVPFGGAGGALIPIITTRKTQSTVTIKSGYTLAIGGLIEKNSENRDTKVPVLGSIPWLGRLFSSESKQVDQRNLIVFITAKILSASGATYRDVFSQRTLYEMGIKARDLPGYEPPPSERELFDDIQNSRDEIERLQTEIKLREQLDLLNSATIKEQKNQAGDETETRRRFK